MEATESKSSFLSFHQNFLVTVFSWVSIWVPFSSDENVTPNSDLCSDAESAIDFDNFSANGSATFDSTTEKRSTQKENSWKIHFTVSETEIIGRYNINITVTKNFK